MMDAVPVSALSLEAVRRMLLLSDQEMGKVRLPEQVRKEKPADVRTQFQKEGLQVVRDRGKVNCECAFVMSTSEFLRQSALADWLGSFDQQYGLPVASTLPGEKFLRCFSLKHK